MSETGVGRHYHATCDVDGRILEARYRLSALHVGLVKVPLDVLDRHLSARLQESWTADLLRDQSTRAVAIELDPDERKCTVHTNDGRKIAGLYQIAS